MPLVNAGRDHIAKAIIGSSVTSFNNANAYLGAGSGNTAFSTAHTDLQGASKTRKAMDSTYPTDPPSPANRNLWRSTFATGDANYAWEEIAVFNAAAAGTMLARLVQSMGTKTSAATWVVTYYIDYTV